MKRFYTKIITCMIIALLAISTTSMFAPVKADIGISPLTYDEYNFSFKGNCQISRGCQGTFLDIRVRGTAANNNNETITLEVFINNTGKTKTYTFLTDGQNHEFKGIFLGWSGGSSVLFTFTGANPEITINMYMEIGS